MSPAPRWISISAASALGIGIIATSAVGVANAMPLVDSTTTASVPPISTVPGSTTADLKGWAGSGDVTFLVPSSSPEVSSSAAPSSAPAVQPAPAQPAPVQRAPAPPPQPVSPDSVSAASPASVDSAD